MSEKVESPRVLSLLAAVLPVLSDIDKGRLLGYGECLAAGGQQSTAQTQTATRPGA